MFMVHRIFIASVNYFQELCNSYPGSYYSDIWEIQSKMSCSLMSLPVLTFFIGSSLIFWANFKNLKNVIWSIFPTPSCPVISRHIAELIAGEGVTAGADEARGWDLLDIIPVSWTATGGGRLDIRPHKCERRYLQRSWSVWWWRSKYRMIKYSLVLSRRAFHLLMNVKVLTSSFYPDDAGLKDVFYCHWYCQA